MCVCVGLLGGWRVPSVSLQDPAKTQQLFEMMSLRDVPGKKTLFIYLDLMQTVSRSAEGALKAATALQCQILGLFWDKVFRMKGDEKIRECCSLRLVWSLLSCHLSV